MGVGGSLEDTPDIRVHRGTAMGSKNSSRNGFIRKIVLSNIWANLGYENAEEMKSTVLAFNIAAELGVSLQDKSEKWAIGDIVTYWVRENRPELLKTPEAKRKFKKVRTERPTSKIAHSTRDKFYKSWEWRTVRMKALKQFGPVCMCCGSKVGDVTANGDPVRICVDHIKPVYLFWQLRLDPANLQILCDECNQGKGAWDHTDWRP